MFVMGKPKSEYMNNNPCQLYLSFEYMSDGRSRWHIAISHNKQEFIVTSDDATRDTDFVSSVLDIIDSFVSDMIIDPYDYAGDVARISNNFKKIAEEILGSDWDMN